MHKKKFPQREFIKLFYELTTSEMARYFDTSIVTIRKFAKELGLKKRETEIIPGGLPQKNYDYPRK